MIRENLSALPTYVPGKRLEGAVKLSSNETAQPPLPAATAAMTEAVAGANRYPDMGAVELRKELAEHLGLTVDQVAVGTGSSALCQQLAQITCGPGDEIAFPWRSFEAYPIFAHVVGATPVPVPLTEHHEVDLLAMAAAVTPRTKLVFVCNPNNPTGTTITTEQFRDFLSKVPTNVLIALDEAYFEYNTAANSPVATDFVSSHPNVVGLRTFSKAYSLAGVRVGYAFGPSPIIAALNKVAIPFSVSSVAQAGATASLRAQSELAERIAETVAQRARLSTALATYGAQPSEANFVWLPATDIASLGSPAEVADRLSSRGVLVRAFPEGIRVTVTTEAETDAFLRAWEA